MWGMMGSFVPIQGRVGRKLPLKVKVRYSTWLWTLQNEQPQKIRLPCVLLYKGYFSIWRDYVWLSNPNLCSALFGLTINQPHTFLGNQLQCIDWLSSNLYTKCSHLFCNYNINTQEGNERSNIKGKKESQEFQKNHAIQCKASILYSSLLYLLSNLPASLRICLFIILIKINTTSFIAWKLSRQTMMFPWHTKYRYSVTYCVDISNIREILWFLRIILLDAR